MKVVIIAVGDRLRITSFKLIRLFGDKNNEIGLCQIRVGYERHRLTYANLGKKRQKEE